VIDRNTAPESRIAGFTPPPLRDQAIAVFVAIICALGFLRTSISPGNALLPYPPEVMQPLRDVALAGGMDEAEIRRGNLSMGDKFNQSLAWDRIIQDHIREGDLPLWTRDIAGGVPFVPQMGQVYHPINLLLLVLPSTGVYGIWYLLHLVLFGFFAYRFMRRIAIGHAAAVFGMVALILAFWTQARIHHNVMLSSALPVFAMLSCTHHIFRHGGRSGHIAMLALGTGMCWLTGFAPGSLMCTYLVCSFAVALWLTSPCGLEVRTLARFGAGVACGLLIASVQLVPVLLASAESSRLPATIQGLAPRTLELPHLVTAIWPTLFSWPGDHIYPGMNLHSAWPALAFLDGELDASAALNFPETAFYAGLAPLALALGNLRSRVCWFFAAAALFAIAMAEGWLLQVSQFLPGAHSGDVRRFLLLFGVCVPVLAASGLDRWIKAPRRGPPFFFALVVGVLSLALLLFHLTDVQEFYGGLAEQRLGLPEGTMKEWVAMYPAESAVQHAQLFALFAAATAVSVIVACLLWRPGRFTVPALCVVTAAELMWHGSGTIIAVPNERVTTPPAILQPVLQSARNNGVRPRLQRLMPPDEKDNLNYAVWPNMAAFWGVEDLAAYSPLPKSRMEQFFLALEPDEAGKTSTVLGGTGVGALRRPESLSHPLADLVGIEWVISSTPLDRTGIEDRTPDAAGPFFLYRRSTCLPRATFLSRAVVIEDATERRSRLAARSHDPRTVVLLEDLGAPVADGPPTAATVEVLSHADEEVRISVGNPAPGYLRLADPYDAGWTATVDGRDATVYIADHYFRAVFLPPGDHEVVFRYNGTRVVGPQIASLVALLLLAVLWWHARSRASTRNAT
jgi:Bacterial membrane protein YfhO